MGARTRPVKISSMLTVTTLGLNSTGCAIIWWVFWLFVSDSLPIKEESRCKDQDLIGEYAIITDTEPMSRVTKRTQYIMLLPVYFLYLKLLKISLTG